MNINILIFTLCPVKAQICCCLISHAVSLSVVLSPTATSPQRSQRDEFSRLDLKRYKNTKINTWKIILGVKSRNKNIQNIC